MAASDALVRTYLKLKADREALGKEYKNLDDELKRQQGLVQAAMMKLLLANKVNSMATDEGTFFKRREVKPSPADWPTYLAWVAENEAWDGVEKRVTKNFITAYMEEHKGKLPPGVKVYEEFVVGIHAKQ